MSSDSEARSPEHAETPGRSAVPRNPEGDATSPDALPPDDREEPFAGATLGTVIGGVAGGVVAGPAGAIAGGAAGAAGGAAAGRQ